MISLNATQQSIINSTWLEPSWLFEVTDTNIPTTYYWSTKAKTFSGQPYTFKVTNIGAIQMRDAGSANALQAPNTMNFTVSDAGSALSIDDFIDGSVLLKLVINNGTNEEIIRQWKFNITRAERNYQTVIFSCEDIIQRYLDGVYPNTTLIKDIAPDDASVQKDNICVPVVFGSAYIPLRSIYDTDKRYYIIGGDTAPTYDITEVRSPREWGLKSTWTSGSYTFTQTNLTINSIDYKAFRPIIADANNDGTADAAGLWRNGDMFLDCPTKFTRSDTSSLTAPGDVIEYVLEDFGVPSADIDTGVGSSFETANSQITGESIRNASYKWTLSGSGTNEYYLEAIAGGDPGIASPVGVRINSIPVSEGTIGSLSAGTWGYGDNDSLGYDSVYVRLSDGTDPDTKATDYIQTGWGLSFNGGFFYQSQRSEFLAQLLYSCHSVLDITDKVELRVLSKTSQKTIDKSNITNPSVMGPGSFKYSPITQKQTDSGYIAFQELTDSTDYLHKVLVTAKSTKANIANTVLAMPLVRDGQNAQRLGTLAYQRSMLRKANISFSGLPSLLALQPGDVITINHADYGGNYDVVVSSLSINKYLTIEFNCTQFKQALDDWGDLSPSAITVATDDSSSIWQPTISGPDSTTSSGAIPNTIQGRLRIGETGNYILFDPSEPIQTFVEGGVTRVEIGDLGTNDYGYRFRDKDGNTLFSSNKAGVNKLGGFYATDVDFWGGNASLSNAATTIVLGDLTGTPKIALGGTANSMSVSNAATYPGFYADGAGNFRVGDAVSSISMTAGGGVVISAGAAANLPSDEYLVSYWNLDAGSGNEIIDSSTQGNDLTKSNPGVTWADGISGKCLSFDGTGSAVVPMVNPLLGATACTVSLWCKKTAYVQYQTMISDYGGSNQNLILGYEASENSIRFYIGGGATADAITASGFSQDVWHHVVGVFDGVAGTLSIFIDGVKTTKNTAITAMGAVSTTFPFLGGYASYEFNGLIDEVRLYTTALTDNEVKALYLYPSGNKSTKISANQITTGSIVSTDSNTYFDLDNKALVFNNKASYGSTTAGIFIGDDSGTYKLNVGDSSEYLKWDGTNLSISGTLSVSSQANLPLETHLKYYYSFDDSSSLTKIIDNSNVGGNATAVGTPIFEIGVAGKCIGFDGASECIIADSPVGLSSGVTLSGWIYVNSYVLWAGISFLDHTQNTGWGFTPVSATTIRVFVNGSASYSDFTIPSIASSWAHVCVVENSGVFYLYLNGEFINSSSIATPTYNALYNKLQCGRWSTTYGAYYFNGYMDEVRLYNTALTANEVKALYLYPSGNKSSKISGNQITTGSIISTDSNTYFDLDNKLLAINSGTYGNDGIQLEYNSGNPRAYIGDGANQYLKFDGTNLSWQGTNSSLTAAGAFSATNATITGVVTANTGYIGGVTGWVIATGKITSSGIGVATTAGDANYAFWAGNDTPASAAFNVTHAGVLSATGASISGTITATAGTIGGWTLSSTSLTGGDTTLHSTGYLNLGTSNDIVKLSSVDGTYRLWIGHATAASAPFRVTKTGAVTCTNITATGGTISSWTIASNRLYAGSGSTFMSLYPGVGISLGSETYALAPFSVSNAGVIKAESGTIGGCVLGSSSIQSTSFTSGPLGTGWQINNNGTAEFQNVSVRGVFKTAVFEKDTISAVNGNLLITKADILDSDMTALDASTLTISGETTFVVDEVLRIKDGVDDEWLLVTNAASAPTYTVTRDLAGAYAANTNPIWTAGTTVVSMGSGSGTKTGWVSIDSSSANSPYIDIYGRNSTTYTAYTLHGRFGWLKGITDADVGLSSTDVWGLYTDNAYIKGVIVADTGYIGGTSGWVIAAGKITSTDIGIATTTGDGIYAFWAGDNTPANAEFRVSHTGALRAASADITGAVEITSGSGLNNLTDATNLQNYNAQGQAENGLIAGTTITGGGITLSGGGSIKGGQTAYDTGTGFFLGYSSGYKLSIGNASGNKLTWDGTSLDITGSLTVTSADGITVEAGGDITLNGDDAEGNKSIINFGDFIHCGCIETDLAGGIWNSQYGITPGGIFMIGWEPVYSGGIVYQSKPFKTITMLSYQDFTIQSGFDDGKGYLDIDTTQVGTPLTLVSSDNSGTYTETSKIILKSDPAGTSDIEFLCKYQGTEYTRLYLGNQNCGFGTDTPLAFLESRNAAGEQLRLSYNDSVYTDLTTSSAGNLTISPTGDTITTEHSVGALTSSFEIKNTNTAVAYTGGLTFKNTNITYANYYPYIYGLDSSLIIKHTNNNLSSSSFSAEFDISQIILYQSTRFQYNGGNYTDLSTGATGELTIAPTGSIVNVTGTIHTGGTMIIEEAAATQLQIKYDGSNYVNFNVSSAGALVINPEGSVSDRVGINIAPVGAFHIYQPGATAAIPVLYLQQADVSEEFIYFSGTSAANASNSLTSWTSGNTIQGFIRVEINGTLRWIPFYDSPTS